MLYHKLDREAHECIAQHCLQLTLPPDVGLGVLGMADHCRCRHRRTFRNRMLLLLSRMKENRVKYSKESGYRGRRRRGNVSRHLLVQTRWISSYSAVATCSFCHDLAEETSYELRRACFRYKNISLPIMPFFKLGRTHITSELLVVVICSCRF